MDVRSGWGQRSVLEWGWGKNGTLLRAAGTSLSTGRASPAEAKTNGYRQDSSDCRPLLNHNASERGKPPLAQVPSCDLAAVFVLHIRLRILMLRMVLKVPGSSCASSLRVWRFAS